MNSSACRLFNRGSENTHINQLSSYFFDVCSWIRPVAVKGRPSFDQHLSKRLLFLVQVLSLTARSCRSIHSTYNSPLCYARTRRLFCSYPTSPTMCNVWSVLFSVSLLHSAFLSNSSVTRSLPNYRCNVAPNAL